LSSIRPANHHRVRDAGDGAAQPLNRLLERHRLAIAGWAVAVIVGGFGLLAILGAAVGTS
jgi:hypothetical protein